MKTNLRDFIVLFNALWYRDFPVIPGYEDLGKRAVWTTHIASVVKQVADLQGFFTCFESGGRTDAVIQNAQGAVFMKVEWEWSQPKNENVNELDKLANSARANEANGFVYIGYSRPEHHELNLEKIKAIWSNIEKPLIVILIKFDYHDRRRHFNQMQTYYLVNGNTKKVREQEVLPWLVENSKWQAQANYFM